ncbi:hypothetical protein O181_047935 [Austropuccinia psidii MF-1]|uniref:Secreted protein n=1 Tax=Austropuccinia psidii MF-1 TaxID=1389203 RepID=A0A9Q3DW95_9BASI|nr:hypothetical protein [Austropuccinia psidii MF-1]
MFKYYLLLVAFLITLVSVGAEQETCAFSFAIDPYDKTNSSVYCNTAPRKQHRCTKDSCHVANVALDKALFYTDCHQERANAWIGFVWPAHYLINHNLNHVTIPRGQQSSEKTSARSTLTEQAYCPLDNDHPENSKLVVCNSCGKMLPP